MLITTRARLNTHHPVTLSPDPLPSEIPSLLSGVRSLSWFFRTRPEAPILLPCCQLCPLSACAVFSCTASYPRVCTLHTFPRETGAQLLQPGHCSLCPWCPHPKDTAAVASSSFLPGLSALDLFLPYHHLAPFAFLYHSTCLLILQFSIYSSVYSSSTKLR